MTNGVYTVNYTGKQGIGSASLVLLNEQIFGVDVAGSEYTGTYKIVDNKIVGEININVPPGATLVTGAPVSAQPYIIPFPFSMPAGINEQQTVLIQVQLPYGAVNANVKKVKNITV
jgi:hypothetical protein